MHRWNRGYHTHVSSHHIEGRTGEERTILCMYMRLMSMEAFGSSTLEEKRIVAALTAAAWWPGGRDVACGWVEVRVDVILYCIGSSSHTSACISILDQR